MAAKDSTAAAAAIAAGYRDVPSISIDNGIMEKASGLRVVPGAFGWNDVGSWAALPAMRPPDARGNVVLGGATLIDGDGNIVVAEEGAPFVGVVGVRDLVVVATRDALLVVPKDKAQDVRKIVEAAKQAGRTDLLVGERATMAMNPRVFREYDIRGVAESDFPDDFVADLGRAIGAYFADAGARRVTLGRDCRISVAAHPRHLQARAARPPGSTSSTSASSTRPVSTSRSFTWAPTAA